MKEVDSWKLTLGSQDIMCSKNQKLVVRVASGLNQKLYNSRRDKSVEWTTCEDFEITRYKVTES